MTGDEITQDYSEKTKKMHPNSLKNLKILSTRGEVEQRKIRSDGGKALKDNPNAKIAARLREMRKKGLNNEGEAMIFRMMTDYNMSEMYILEYIQKMIKESHEIKDMNIAVQRALDWHAKQHGTKENDSKHLISAIVLTDKEKEDLVIRLSND